MCTRDYMHKSNLLRGINGSVFIELHEVVVFVSGACVFVAAFFEVFGGDDFAHVFDDEGAFLDPFQRAQSVSLSVRPEHFQLHTGSKFFFLQLTVAAYYM